MLKKIVEALQEMIDYGGVEIVGDSQRETINIADAVSRALLNAGIDYDITHDISQNRITIRECSID
jgi:hypothetical protein